MKLSIDKTGHITTIYSPESAKLLKAVGDITIRRASFVESGSSLSSEAVAVLMYQGRWCEDALTQWWADMQPAFRTTHPDLILGPFESNVAAIAAEVEFINQNLHKITHDRTS